MVGFGGHDYEGAASEADWPKGCYYCKNTADCGDGVWFNSHGSGNTVAGTRRFCQKNYDPKAVEILFVGDSDIDYWDSAVGFPGSFNVGIGGYDTADVVKEVDQWVADLDPKWVVIVCGENDIGGKRTATSNALTRFKTIVGKFINDGARVIYLGTKPEPGSKNLYKEYEYYDEELRKFATEQAKGKDSPPSFQMIDVFKSFTSQKELYNSDNLHMSLDRISRCFCWFAVVFAIFRSVAKYTKFAQFGKPYKHIQLKLGHKEPSLRSPGAEHHQKP